MFITKTPPRRKKKRMFRKILIANRGEIAIRVMQTCRELGIRTVAVYSEADTNALHVRMADEAVYVGPPPSIESYLSIPKILNAIDQTGADAVHPGYGFLSENAEFAAALAARGVTLIGPPVEAIRLMGDKIESKKIAKKAGVNIVPGGLEQVSTEREAKRLAARIGYPVIIKAAAGGGGKGMRVARDERELEDGLRMAASEAESSFGDARVFIEKYFGNPRHIEIQILADQYGNTLYLGERECSIQRRHQKVIEEAPSSFVDDALRAKMGRQAVALAKKVGYYSAGTVEFIVDEKGNFYFLEMNTRLQVEHRVTELVTDIDLVEQMIRIAAGESLELEQKDVKLEGWAFEARVYAEDPRRGFLPSVGRITRYREPEAGTGTLLIDTGIYEGGEVSMYYDPMVAKVCTHAATRTQAIDAMKAALSAYVIEGIAHNISFLCSVLANPRFVAGDISTNFIAQEYPEGFANGRLTEEVRRVLLAVGLHVYLRDAERAALTSGQLPGRQRFIDTRWVVSVGGHPYSVVVKPQESGYDISYDEGLLVVRSAWHLGRDLFQGTVNGRSVSVQIKALTEGFRLSYGESEAAVKVRTPRVAELAAHMPQIDEEEDESHLVAPIAGLVSSVLVAEGDAVVAGQNLIVIEAMKMENILTASRDGTVERVQITAPQSVTAGQVLIEFAEPAEEVVITPSPARRAR
jgi:propionyl-CoA carboxylase alpha chain